MTVRTKTAIITLTMAMLLLISCHTESPAGIDNVDPSVKILTVYTDADTLYDSASGSAFTDFSDTLLTEQLNFKVEISDDQELYKVGIIAEDVLSGSEYEVIISSAGTNGEYCYIDQLQRFSGSSGCYLFQQFYLKAFVSDDSENTALSLIKLGSKHNQTVFR